VTLLSARPSGLADRLAALDEVLELADGRLEPEAVTQARAVAAKAGDRLRLGEAHTVVALAGATGSGKSSLVNALAGEAVSQVGMRRPTTGVAHAVVWGDADPGPLLDWLEVPRRHALDASPGGFDGLVLLDLPDVDSVERRHRLEADRLVERVDLLVWVLDPQKYADGVIHDRYLAPLAGHADVMLVVLNQVDRLSPAARAACLADLGELLRSEGLGDVPVLAVSARTGEGLDALRAQLAERVGATRTAVRRLEADLATLAVELGAGCEGTAADGVGRAERGELVDALAAAAGADAVADAVARTHRLRARQATGWPFTRWLSRVRADPARRLRLREAPSDLVRTSLPGPSAVQRARVDSALRVVGDAASQGLAEPWAAAVRRAATQRRPELADLLDRAVAGADLGIGERPRWWRVVGLLQVLLAVVALAGLLWLAVLFGISWLQLPPPPTAHWGPIPLPTLLLVGGVVLGLLVSRISAGAAATGAHRRAERARRRVRDRVEQVAEEAVVTPVERELAAHTAVCRALARLS
jgi:GTP-binding protein EngB required for normal cell division